MIEFMTARPDLVEAVIQSLTRQRARFIDIALYDACSESDRERIKNSVELIDKIVNTMTQVQDSLNKNQNQSLVELDCV